MGYNLRNKNIKHKYPTGMIILLSIFILTSIIITCIAVALTNNDDDPVAVIFDGVKITKSEYTLFRRNSAIELINKIKFPEDSTDEEKKQMIKAYIEGEDGGKTFWEKVDQAAIEEVKKFAIRKADAEKKNITLSQDEVLAIEAECDQMALYYDDTDQYFLDNFGIPREKYVNVFITMGKLDKLIDEYIEEQNYTSRTLKAFYEENEDMFKTWSVRHILILTSDFNNEEDGDNTQNQDALKEKQQLAKDLLERVKKGEDMEKLVEEYSDDPTKDLNKGLSSVTADSDYLFKDWALKAKAGDTELVENEYGYYILKCEKVTSYDDVKDMVKKAYGTREYSGHLKERLEQVKTEPKIYKKVIDRIDMDFLLKIFN